MQSIIIFVIISDGCARIFKVKTPQSTELPTATTQANNKNIVNVSDVIGQIPIAIVFFLRPWCKDNQNTGQHRPTHSKKNAIRKHNAKDKINKKK